MRNFKYFCLPYKRKEDNYDTGSGLGLNISAAIMGEHDCTIKVEKKLTQGLKSLLTYHTCWRTTND